MSDLETGDALGPLEQRVSSFLIREYAHAVEEPSERHQGMDDQVATPTIVHAFKKRLLEHACPDGAGPQARLHLVYDATHRAMIPAGAELELSAVVSDRFERKGREHIAMTFEVRDKLTGAVYTSYEDTTLLSYRSQP
jgi:hypothetical protein